jgi:glycosyltransferase involved in cell wall biosynthesis
MLVPMTDRRLPTVTVLMPAYNYANYIQRAIESVLAQDYPADLLTLVVVDDGSTDGTAAIVEEIVDRNPGRLASIRQPNSGPSAAINRALSEASGEFVAVLDADDIWLPSKTRIQTQMLADDPALGLVFCDMTVVDGNERVVRPSQVGEIGVFPRRAFAQLLCQNVVTQSSLMIRRELARPIPPGVPYSDWWFAICAAQVSELAYIRQPLALYREHGANLTSGVSGSSGVREHRKEISFQLWALRNLDLSQLTPADVELVWRGVEAHAGAALASARSRFVRLADVAEGDREQAAALVGRADVAARAGDVEAECVLLLQALGWNPYEVSVQGRLIETIERAKAAASQPHPLAGAREIVVLARAEDLLSGDDLLLSYVTAMAGLENVTLAIDASGMQAQAAAESLEALVERCELAERDDIDLLAVVGAIDPAQRHRMISRSAAVYRRLEDGSDGDCGLPVFTPASLSALRELVFSGTRPDGLS